MLYEPDGGKTMMQLRAARTFSSAHFSIVIGRLILQTIYLQNCAVNNKYHELLDYSLQNNQ